MARRILRTGPWGDDRAEQRVLFVCCNIAPASHARRLLEEQRPIPFIEESATIRELAKGVHDG